MGTKHIADKEVQFIAVSVAPDMCRVGGVVVPFDISRTLDHAVVHSPDVHARGVPVLRVTDVIQGVEGDAGQGVKTGTSQGSGRVVLKTGADSVRTNGLVTCRHRSDCEMN